jgi:saccharopine dehydrogenase-like NADP-dependent oxidoreductase
MARTTGYTCNAVAELLLNGHYKKPGISPPEYVGREQGCYESVMNYLRARQVHYEIQ